MKTILAEIREFFRASSFFAQAKKETTFDGLIVVTGWLPKIGFCAVAWMQEPQIGFIVPASGMMVGEYPWIVRDNAIMQGRLNRTALRLSRNMRRALWVCGGKQGCMWSGWAPETECPCCGLPIGGPC